MISVAPVVGHLQINLRMIWRFFSRSMLNLALLWKSRCMLHLLVAVDLLQPSPPIESSLHLMLIPFVQIRHRYMDLAGHPGLGPLLKTVRVQGTTTAATFVTVAVRKNAFWNGSFLATRLATVEGPVHGDPLLPDNWNFHGSHLRNTRCDSHQEGHPLQSE